MNVLDFSACCFIVSACVFLAAPFCAPPFRSAVALFDESLASCKAAKLLHDGGIQDFDARNKDRILASDISLFKLSVANRQTSANY